MALGLTEADWSAWYRLFSAPAPRLRGADRAVSCGETLAAHPGRRPVRGGGRRGAGAAHSRTMPGTAWLKAPRTPPWKPGLAPRPALRPPGRAAAAHARRLQPGAAAALGAGLPGEGGAPGRDRRRARSGRRRWPASRWLRAAARRGRARGRSGCWCWATAPTTWPTCGRRCPPTSALLARCAQQSGAVRSAAAGTAGGGGRRASTATAGAAPRPTGWRERAGWQTVTLRGARAVDPAALPGRGAVRGPARRRAARSSCWWSGASTGRRRRRRRPPRLLAGLGRRARATAGRCRCRPRSCWPGPGSAGRWRSCHRELKSGFGLGEVQCWDAALGGGWPSSGRPGPTACWCWPAYRAWGLTGQPLRPPGRWWGGARRWSLGTLWRGYRHELWGALEFRALWTGTGAEWREKATWVGGLQNAVAGSLRV